MLWKVNRMEGFVLVHSFVQQLIETLTDGIVPLLMYKLFISVKQKFCCFQ